MKGTLFLFVVTLLLGVWVGLSTEQSLMDRQAITHHAAHYDPQTAAFKWNDEKP